MKLKTFLLFVNLSALVIAFSRNILGEFECQKSGFFDCDKKVTRGK